MEYMTFLKDTKAGNLLTEIRTNVPLVWNISNFVSMDIAANLLLSIGASPAMAHAIEEANSFSNLCKAINGALTINIGTFDMHWQNCALKVATEAKSKKIPWVLDPVGAGASEFRNRNAQELLSLKPTVLKGNGSEIISISGQKNSGKGVDSTSTSNEALDAAIAIAKTNEIIVAVTGKVDYVTDGSIVYGIHGGNEMMTKITATGCALTCLVGAGLTSKQDHLLSTANILGIYSLASDKACKVVKGPGSLRTELIDVMYNLAPEEVEKNIKIELI